MKENQLKDIENLMHLCEEYEQLSLKLNWDTLRSRKEDDPKNFFYYTGDQLVGFCALYDFGNKVELCGMVDPGFRRQGIFTKLFQEAIAFAETLHFRAILLNAPGNSLSAKAFLQKLPCEFEVAEYQMKWHETKLENDEGIHLRPVGPEDDEAQIQLDIQCFGFLDNEARAYNQQIKLEEQLESAMIEVAGETIGKIRIDCKDEGNAWIYGFAIFPKHQGNGYGRKVLKKVVIGQRNLGNDIFLEVEATNEQALKLYQSCGFETFSTQDYYRYTSTRTI